MADYDAKIRVSADTRQAERSLQDLEAKVNSLVNGLDIGKKVGRSFTEAFVPPQQLKQLDRELATIASRADTVAKRFARVVEGVGTLGIAAKGITDVGQTLEQLSVSAQTIAANFNNANAAAKVLIPGFNLARDSANLLSKTIGTLEFKFSALVPNAEAVVTALSSIGPQAGLAAGAVAAIGAAFETVLKGRAKQLESEVGGVLKTITEQTQQLLRTLEALNVPLSGTVRQFQNLLRTGQERLANVSSYSDEARRALNTILTAETRLTAELERQAVLRREMEASRFASVAQRTGMQFTFGGPKALPMAGQTAFQGAMRGGIGGGARTLVPSQTEMLVNAAGGLASRSGIEARATTASLQFTTALSTQVDKIKALTAGEQEITKAVNARLLPAFNEQRVKEGTVKLLTDEVRLTESVNRIEGALNGQRARGVRFLEKQTAEEKRQIELGILGQKTNQLRPFKPSFPTEGPIPPSLGRAAAPRAVPGAPLNLGKRAATAFSSAAVGGAFPLLFGQSGQAAAGGAIGGLLGSIVPGIGGFGGSLIGTLIGEKVGQGNKVKELAADIGFSAEQTKLLGIAFQQAGRDFDKFQASVSTIQGLSLSIEDQARAVQLASTLTENYGGKIDKVTNAFAGALSTGKVTQGTLNQLTSQGIPIQEALANKYNVSRTALLQLAKDGKISTQDLIDTLVELGNKGPEEVQKNVSALDRFKTAAQNLGASIATLGSNIIQGLTPAFNFLISNLTKVFNLAVQGLNAINAQFAAGRAGALNRNISSAKLAVTGGGIPFLRAPSAGLEQVATGIGQLTPQKNKAGIQQNLSAISQYSAVLQKIPPSTKEINDRAQNLQGVLLKLQRQNEQALKNIPKASTLLKTFAAPGQLPPSGGGGTKGSDEAARKAKRLKEETEKQLQASTKLLEINKAQLAVAQATDPLKEAEAQYALDLLRINENYTEKLKESKSIKETNNLIASKELELEILRSKYLKDQTAELLRQAGITTPGFGLKPTGIDFNQAFQFKGTLPNGLTDEIGTVTENLTKLLDPIEQVKSAAESIGSAFSTSFKGLIDGSQSAQQALAGFFQSVASSFLDAAAKIIAEWIRLTILNSILPFFPSGSIGIGNTFSNFTPSGGAIPSLADSLRFVPGRAVGGPVTSGSPYIVGEKGPELFVPGRSGTIVPNNAMMGGSTSVVVNVDASGNSNVQGDQAQGKQLGLAVSAAVQAELVKQKRPGGLLYSR